jgi:chromosome partitioning protein
MRTLLVANPKGGSGKTTLATHVAGWLAGKRQRVVLADRDPQGSATEWLARRPPLFPPIIGLSARAKKHELRGYDPQYVVVDTPAGLRGDDLDDTVRSADVLLVPVSPSAFDIAAAQRFVAAIGEIKAVRRGAIAVGLIAMRVDPRTVAAGELDAFLGAVDHSLVAHLRDTQLYVHCARDGATVFDLPRSRAELDWEQWRPLTRWIARQLAPGAR